MDQDKPEIFFYGRVNGQNYNLVKYNYHSNEISAKANKLPGGGTSIEMRLYSTENGQELFFPQGTKLDVYDAGDLNYKYELAPENIGGYDDFAYLGNNIFCFTTSKAIFTYKRTNANLEFIDKKEHFSTHFGNGNYHLIPLKGNEILVGYFQEPQSFKFSISSTGKISNQQLVNIPIKSRWKKKTLYSPERDYVVNLLENRLYSTNSFNLEDSFEKPYYPSGISRNGNLILGSSNNPDDYSGNESTFERKIQLYNLSTGKVTTVESKGFPHLLFENYLGQIISISSGFYRQNLENSTPKPDIFVEVIQ
ncbi:hypothetical protein [Salinimicrobium marinum]|nr:hypothetical protein [Salinimicrobium marinum]